MKKRSSFIFALVFISLFQISAFTIQSFKNKKLDYFNYLHHFPKTLGPFGSYQEGEIEIVKTKDEIDLCEYKTGRKIGVMAKDSYWIWINDPVRFPNGTYGVYGRIIWKNSLNGPIGIAALPVTQDGKIALNLNYRHATRSWEYEIPRGGKDQDEELVDTTKRELQEETGLIANEVIFLGDMAVDTGFTNTVAKVYFAKVESRSDSAPEDSEAIEGIHFFTLEEIKNLYKAGSTEKLIKGVTKTVYLRDPFLSYALFQASLQGLISLDSSS